jgi:glycosyltransferase involved in cell wall biosynthesis
MEAEWFECGTDLDTYTFSEGPREPATVAVYARQETARRGVELALAALAMVKRRRPDVRVVLFGSNTEVKVPFDSEDLGVVSPRELAELYRHATVGVVFSLTTHSLVAHEMMAAGLPVVELAGDNVASALGPSGEVVVQADPDPVSVAAEIEALIDDRERGAAMARRARAFVEERDWDRAGAQLERALRSFLARPRDPHHGFDPSPPRVAATLGGRPYDRLTAHAGT